ncbi:MAG: TonB-dependent receptor [Opitutaceae bacterium]|jgi:outer membrane receptor protein involved in Fe transport|nr:TonB-dependent receptor [Opitutaceae bacterium]
MQHPHSRRRPALVLAVCLASAALPRSAAQPAPAPAAGDGEETVRLSPFTVTGSREESYGATDSITGSRIRTEVKDLPFALNVITDTFLDEMSAYTLGEQMAYTSAFSPGESDQDYQLRGIASARKLRNGFVNFGVYDKLGIDRVEVIKGPVASIYGQTQPGGIINTITKRPRAARQLKLATQAGSFDFLRTELLHTGALVPGKINTLVGAAWQENGGEQEFFEFRRAYATGMVEFTLDSRTKLELDLEWLKDEGTTESPLYYNYEPDPGTTSPRVARGYNLDDLLHFNNNGPHAADTRDVSNASLTFERRLDTAWSLRSGLAFYAYRTERMAAGGDLYQVDLRRIINRNPVFVYSEGNRLSSQTDLLGQFHTGPVRHRLLFTVDLAHTEGSGHRLQLPAGWDDSTSNPYYSLKYLYIDNPDYRLPPKSALTDRFRDQSSATDAVGFFVSEQAFLFDDRLLLMGGFRYDYAQFDSTDLSAGTHNDYDDSDFTYQLGANYALLPGMRAYANYSTSFYPQARLSPDGEPYPNEQGEGFEAGVKANLFSDRIILCANVFKVERKNIVIRTVDASGNDAYLLSGSVESKGVELDFNLTPVKGLLLYGACGYVDAEYTKMEDARLVGLPPTHVPRFNFGAAARYEIQRGPLRRLYFLISEHSQSKARGTDSTNARRYLVYQPSYSVWSAAAGFKHTDRKGVYHKWQLSVKNLADEAYLAGRRPGAGIGWTARYEVQF